MNAEIIAVGSELLLGQIANTNAQYISEQLATLGMNVFYHTVVGDNPERLKKVLEIADSRSELIILTGGLGPTKDDLTKDVVAGHVARKLVIDSEAMAAIEAFFRSAARPMTENNRRQALVIEGSRVLPNEVGMAPGMVVTIDKHVYILMPGPPHEMKPMFANHVKPFLNTLNEEPIISRVLRFFGIGESKLETEIIDLIDNQTNPTIAPLAKEGEVTLRLTAKHADRLQAEHLLDELEARIQARVGAFFYGYGETSLAAVVFDLLNQKGLTVAAAESLTGGLFSQQLTDVPGASAVFNGGVVCYTNAVKRDILGVSEEILEAEGAVSESCAVQLAEGVRARCGADIGISFTGVAGPDKSEGKEVGTVYIGLAAGGKTHVFSKQINGNRADIRQRTILHGFDVIRRYLAGRSPFDEKIE
ncbi:competence/damage-inducible protein A [Camelliibacillus cellulosilyticus]|uniref:Putative competence-damage inducible protein n=1 Tax=Camelliibacillus cellulosilyticus TaxID=2174486 RepID=A0ABV9GHQ5_9BACL